jgi:hypothetical protein
MSDEPQPSVIGSLPRTRPHRRSDKRAAPPTGTTPVDAPSAAEPAVAKPTGAKRTRAAAAPKRAPAAAKPKRAPVAAQPRAAKPAPAATPPAPAAARPSEPATADAAHGVFETAVQAAAELAEIGLHASARALRRAVSRLPRP